MMSRKAWVRITQTLGVLALVLAGLVLPPGGARPALAISDLGRLTQLHQDGSIWTYTGQPCSGSFCPGWALVDNDPQARLIFIRPTTYPLSFILFKMRADGSIWGSSGTEWLKFDNNPDSINVVLNTGGGPYQIHRSGSIWRWTGAFCSGTSCPGWQLLDNNPGSGQIAVTDSTLFQLHRDGSIWRSTGQPCSNGFCPGWQLLDNNPHTTWITTDAGGNLYQRHDTGAIWQWTGQTCPGGWCSGWRLLDDNRTTDWIVADDYGTLYQSRSDGSILAYTGTPCANGSCPGWRLLDNNPQTEIIVAGGSRAAVPVLAHF